MKHLIVCREYPPAPSGGIGVYAVNISRLLAEQGETVHVIGQLWEKSAPTAEVHCQGRLIVHRVPFEDGASLLPRQPHPALKNVRERALFASDFSTQCFSWQVGLLAERLIEQEEIEIIEAQDYEAPLYYFQLRRALGMGPRKCPPCLVHLHSPTELIAQHNDWNMSLPKVLTAKRFEDFSIGAADALLSPSKFLARQAETHFGLEQGSIQIVPYPIGGSRKIERDWETWEQGTICYVGRLEPRKGVIELVEAAIAIAQEFPKARFEFVGDDTFDMNGASVRESLESLISRDLRSRFCFRGPRNNSSLPQFLARARMAIIPSRWENFPNTCIEAMASGLPVIASRQGGMAEMIEDGLTGWLASEPGSAELAEALRRALKTAPAKIAEMGNGAASAIRRICNNESIVAQHLELRSRIVNRGAKGSLRLPVNLPWAKRPLSDGPPTRVAVDDSRTGLAIVITWGNGDPLPNQCLQSLQQQSRQPGLVVAVDCRPTQKRTITDLDEARKEGWLIIEKPYAKRAVARQCGIEAILSSDFRALGFAFLCSEDRLEPNFVEICDSILQRCPEVGLVSSWAYDLRASKAVWSKPCPSFPYQWLSNEAAPFSVIRTEALIESGILTAHGGEDWDLFNAVMAAGWAAVTVPEILAHHHFAEDVPRIAFWREDGHGTLRQRFLERFPDLIARDAKEIAFLLEHTSQSLRPDTSPLEKRLAFARLMVRYPSTTVSQIQRRLKNKIVRHTPLWMSDFFTSL